MKTYECFDCGKIFDEDDLKESEIKHIPKDVIQFLFCPNCGSENVETLEEKA